MLLVRGRGSVQMQGVYRACASNWFYLSKADLRSWNRQFWLLIQSSILLPRTDPLFFSQVTRFSEGMQYMNFMGSSAYFMLQEWKLDGEIQLAHTILPATAISPGVVLGPKRDTGANPSLVFRMLEQTLTLPVTSCGVVYGYEARHCCSHFAIMRKLV